MSLHDYRTEQLITMLQAYDQLDYNRMTVKQAEAIRERIEQIRIVLHYRTFNLPANESFLAVHVELETDWSWG